MDAELIAHLPASAGTWEGALDWCTCQALGLNENQVRWLVACGRWQIAFPRVYVTFSGPIPLITRQYAALLYAGPGAVLSFESAGQGWRLSEEPGAIHVTVAYEREVVDQPGLVIHRSRTLGPGDVHQHFVPAGQPSSAPSSTSCRPRSQRRMRSVSSARQSEAG